MPKPGYLNIRVDPADQARVDAVVARTGWTAHEVVRKCFRMGLRLSDEIEPRPVDFAPVRRRPAAPASLPA